MKDGRSCIICNEPVGTGGYLCSIRDMVVSFCEKHSEECKQNCENCAHAAICPATKSDSSPESRPEKAL